MSEIFQDLLQLPLVLHCLECSAEMIFHKSLKPGTPFAWVGESLDLESVDKSDKKAAILAIQGELLDILGSSKRFETQIKHEIYQDNGSRLVNLFVTIFFNEKRNARRNTDAFYSYYRRCTDVFRESPEINSISHDKKTWYSCNFQDDMPELSKVDECTWRTISYPAIQGDAIRKKQSVIALASHFYAGVTKLRESDAFLPVRDLVAWVFSSAMPDRASIEFENERGEQNQRLDELEDTNASATDGVPLDSDKLKEIADRIASVFTPAMRRVFGMRWKHLIASDGKETTLDEIARELGMSSPQNVKYHLDKSMILLKEAIENWDIDEQADGAVFLSRLIEICNSPH